MKYMVHFHQQTRNQVTVWKNSKSINWDEFSWKRDQKVLNASKKSFGRHSGISICDICLWLYVPLEKFSLAWRRHHYRRRASNFEQCPALMAMKHWGFLACHILCDTDHQFIMVISEDNWHSYLLPSFW